MKTTIQIDASTLEKLKSLKVLEKQSYNDIIINLIENVEEEILSEEEIEDLKKALDNVKKGKIKSIEQVAKEMGISL